jgi:hypothetical protein
MVLSRHDNPADAFALVFGERRGVEGLANPQWEPTEASAHAHLWWTWGDRGTFKIGSMPMSSVDTCNSKSGGSATPMTGG